VRVPHLLEVAVVERIRVDDQEATRDEVFQVRFQGSGVHRDQDTRLVAGREDVVVGEVDLERGDPCEGPGGGPDLGGKVGKRREVVTEDRGDAGEAVSGELHAVPGVPCETDNDAV
jgi:hypothetical protein